MDAWTAMPTIPTTTTTIWPTPFPSVTPYHYCSAQPPGTHSPLQYCMPEHNPHHWGTHSLARYGDEQVLGLVGELKVDRDHLSEGGSSEGRWTLLSWEGGGGHQAAW